jgi:hypothetical protein
MLHCGRCGGELNAFAICQPCRLNDTIANSAPQINRFAPTYDPYRNYRDTGPAFESYTSVFASKLINVLHMIGALGFVGVLFLMFVGWVVYVFSMFFG